MFSKNQFLNNVYIVAEEKGISINSLEKLIGVSTGYLAKLRKDDTRKNITIELMIKISEILEISMDYLCKVECDGLSKDEMNVLAFFEKIKRKTLNNNYKWDVEDADLIQNGFGRIANALSIRNEYGQTLFFSKFKNKEVIPIGKSYIVDVKNKISLAIVRIEGESSRALELETYIIEFGDNINVSKVCAAYRNQAGVLDNALFDLYKVAELSERRLALDDRTNKFIKSFLDDD